MSDVYKRVKHFGRQVGHIDLGRQVRSLRLQILRTPLFNSFIPIAKVTVAVML